MSTSKHIKSLDFGGELDQDTLREILPVFFEELEQDYKRFQYAFVQGEYQLMRKFLHKMKGESKSYHFQSIVSDLETISKSAKRKDYNSVRETLLTLTKTIEETKKNVENTLSMKLP